MSDVWKGVALPWGPGLPSFIEPKEDEDILKTSVLFILLTRKGERVMLPEFGSLLPDAVFEPNDPALVAGIESTVREAILEWDDRIEFLEVKAEMDGNELNVKILWKHAKDPMSEQSYEVAFTLTPSVFSASE